MSGSRILWGQLCLCFLIVIMAWSAATQWVAWRLAFQPELGPPWTVVAGRWPLYPPFLFPWWWYEFDAYAPHIFVEGGWIAGSGGVLAFLTAVVLSVRRAGA